MNETLNKYFNKFNDYPLLPYGLRYENEIMIKKMEEAIKRGKPLTLKDFDNVRCEGIYDEEEK